MKARLAAVIAPPQDMPLDIRALTVLLISGDTGDAEHAQAALANLTPHPWRLLSARTLAEGLARLAQGDIDATVLGLELPDSRGAATFAAVFNALPLMPILILTDREHEELAWEVTRHGAQDYVLKEHLDAYWLPRHLRRVIERKAGDDALFEERERAQVTLNSIGDAVLSADLQGQITFLNIEAEKISGWPRAEAIGRPAVDVFRIIDGLTREEVASPMAQATRENRIVGLAPNAILISRDGTETAIEDSAAPIHDRSGRVTGAVIVFRDVSASRAAAREMVHLAQHDFLTDLPNRLLLSDRIDYALTSALRHDRHGAVLFIDLDQFKQINDSLGHRAGDELLQTVAQRLKASVRASDTVARLGGDEFVVLLDELDQPADAAISAAKILKAIAAPCTVEAQTMEVTASIGISLYPKDACQAQALIRRADTAMYFAKRKGRNCACFYAEAIASMSN